jgi:hypothetical protein
VYNPSLHKLLIAARIDDIRRARHGQHAAFADPVNRDSRDNAQHRDFRFIPRRLVARFAH